MTQLSRKFEHKTDPNGEEYLEVSIQGMSLLRLTATNKGTSFTLEERVELGLDGLLPAQVTTLEQQVDRLYHGYQRQQTSIDKYQFLREAQENNEVAFFALLQAHLHEMMPIVYTPTVGLAVQQYSRLYQSPRGLTISRQNVERVDAVLENYPWHDVRLIVATDASAILGIGDQGHGGLSICVGKLALYTAGGGVNPFHTMPMNFDVGTHRRELLEDENYLGIKHPRLVGEEYFTMIDRFVEAVHQHWPGAVIQWEDFAKEVAFEVLNRYRDKVPSFNDDIQGTGAVVLAGLICACRQKGEKLSDQRVVVVGAGAGGVGVASAIQEGMVREGLSREQARRRMFVLDGRGLVVEGVTHDSYKLPVAQFADTYADWDIQGSVPSLMEVVDQAAPTVLIGLTGIAELFSRPIVARMYEQCDRPIIFPLSNPTANCEALPSDLIEWTEGHALIATGSPFDDVTHGDETFPIGQGNNAFVFPGIGLAAMAGRCHPISDGMVLAGAYALADYTAEHHPRRIYPPISELRQATRRVARDALAEAVKEGITRIELGDDLDAVLEQMSWTPRYLPFRRKRD